MPEWAWALIVGAVGGLLNSVVHRDINGIKPYVDKAGHRHLDPGAPGSVFIGAVVGWGVWVMNHPEYTASTPVTTFLPLLSSLLAGLGGGRVLRSYFTRSLQTSALSETAEIAKEVAEALLGETSGNGDENGDRERRAEHRDQR